jgi:succinate dehydrogenase hydrophobic anchor subunit
MYYPLANIQLEATVVSIVNFAFLLLFVYAGIRHARRGVQDNTSDIFHDES